MFPIRLDRKAWWICLSACVTFLVIAGCSDSAAPRPPLEDKRWALALLDRESDAEYDVNPEYSYSSDSTAAPIHATRIAIGTYTVRFPALASQSGWKETVQVSAYGSGSPRRCRVLSWGNQASDLVVHVQCHDFTGSPADSRFNILVASSKALSGRSAFAVSTSLEGGVVPEETMYNPVQKGITVERTGLGRYAVVFEGLTREVVPGSGKEIFHVTPYGDGTAWCKIETWDLISAQDLGLFIRCYSATGELADAQFSVFMLERERSSGHRLGYVWASGLTSPSSTPTASYNYNSLGETNTATRSGPGVYTITWTGLSRSARSTAETNLITAFGNNATYCQVSSWAASSTEFRCYAANGAPADSRFTGIWVE